MERDGLSPVQIKITIFQYASAASIHRVSTKILQEMSSTAFGLDMYGGVSQGMWMEERRRRMRARRHGGKRTSSTCVGQKRLLC